MAKLSDSERNKVIQSAREIIKNSPRGIRTGQLSRELKNQFPEIPNIYWLIYNLNEQFPGEISKPTKGLLIHVNNEALLEKESDSIKAGIPEENFYKPFAEWLVDEEECTRAISLGGSKFKSKWGTPDVIGIIEPRKSDIIKLPTEIVSAEIKTDTRDLITAFGQACSYKLFSHWSYIVVPNSSPEEDIIRIEALCVILGLGLVLFDNHIVENPNFQRKVHPGKHEPEISYANQYIKLVEDQLFD